MPSVRTALDERSIGLMCQPASNRPRAGWLWAADNGCFNDAWDETMWRRWLELALPRAGCLFAAVPDVVADADATLERFGRYAGVVRDARYPVALVAQDGLYTVGVPWREIDALFIGGSTAWKMSEQAFMLADVARQRGVWVHVGRVNSWSRYGAWAAHADSCDGTFLRYGPDVNLPRLTAWLERHRMNPQLWEARGAWGYERAASSGETAE